MDVARQLLLRVALDHTLATDPLHEWPEGSVGHALNSMTRLYLARDLDSAAQLARTDVLAFERLLQEGFRLLRVKS
jgi:hypothetical protein